MCDPTDNDVPSVAPEKRNGNKKQTSAFGCMEEMRTILVRSFVPGVIHYLRLFRCIHIRFYLVVWNQYIRM